MDLTALALPNIQIVVPLFSGLIFFLLFIVVLNANAKSAINRSFAWYMIFNSIWGFSSFLTSLNIDPHEELAVNLVQKAVGVVPSAIAFWLLSLLFLKKNPKWWMIALIPTAVIYFFLFASGLIITVAENNLGAYGPHGRLVPGPLFFEGTGYILILGLIPVALLLAEFFKGSRDEIYHSKVKYLLAASLTVNTFGALFNLNPRLWIYPVDTLGVLISAFILIYALLKYELVDITTYFRNTLIHTLLISGVIAIYIMFVLGVQNVTASFVGNSFWWFALVLALMVGMIFRPINDYIIRKLDELFYRQRYDYRQTLIKFASEIGEILDVDILASSIIRIIKETMGAKFVYLYVDNGGGTIKAVGNSPPDIEFDRGDELVKNLKSSDKVLTPEEASKFFKEKMGGIPERIANLKADLVVPLKIGGGLEGVVFVGGRSSGDFYTQEDTNLLFTLARPAAITLKNARLYKEVLASKEEIEKLYAHDKEVQALKDQFVTIASHELRTPLTSIKGYTDIIKDEKLSREGTEAITNMFANVKRLENLAEELINVASIEKGQLKPTFLPTDIGKLVVELCEGEKPIAEGKGLKFKCEISPSNIGKLLLDPRLIRHAIANLVDNAIKFTSKGGVEILVVKKLKEIVIMVKDTGPGIPKDKQNLLFQKFGKIAGYNEAFAEGHGLGLYLTKLVVDAHQGGVKFESSSKGSTFTINLPIR